MYRALSIVISAGALLGCAKSQAVNQCAPEQWAGECQLASVTKVEDKEFPVPIVVMEAVYRPVQNAQYPEYTPGALAERTMVKAQYELALYDYLEAHPRVACSAQAPSGGACVAPQVKIALAPFDQEAAARASAAPPVTGCAQIEATGSQDNVRQTQATQTLVPQRLQFPESSAQLSPDADAIAGEVAKLLQANPSIECLGIVGQIASGESPALAEERAKAVRDLLGAHGVQLTRLLTIGATAKVFGSGSRPAEADPNDRRVSFSVLLERKAPASP
jgi:outer membrane protein OmpA-like peptidoglycan-associated protein